MAPAICSATVSSRRTWSRKAPGWVLSMSSRATIWPPCRTGTQSSEREPGMVST